ncbi:MAG: SDR family NAD(P)-dependent oxidoreductase [Flavobacteriales bacterium]
MHLSGKHIVITGASSGIGRETCLLLAQAGAKITGIARNETELNELLNQLKKINNEEHRVVGCDLSNHESLEGLVSKLNSCDGIVHAAGIVSPLPVKFIRKKHLDKVWNINTYAPILLTAQLLSEQKINEEASIVFISSISTRHPYFGGAMYVSSKAAIEAYSRNLGLELVGKKIRSNVVSPALVKTKIFNQTIEASDAEKLKEYENNYPFGFGEPIDIANAIEFFISDKSRWITGQNLILDGGLTLSQKS